MKEKMSDQKKESEVPWLLLLPFGIAGILFSEWIGPKVTAYNARVRAESFAEMYLDRKEKATKGDKGAQEFIEVANRRLRKHYDDAVMNNVEAKLFLEDLKSRGISERDYK